MGTPKVENLLHEVLSLIAQRIFVQVSYEDGRWYYILHQLPSEDDLKFAQESSCEDRDLWARSEILNEDWYLGDGYDSYIAALQHGVGAGKLALEEITDNLNDLK
jgi:hypothetical protein